MDYRTEESNYYQLFECPQIIHYCNKFTDDCYGLILVGNKRYKQMYLFLWLLLVYKAPLNWVGGNNTQLLSELDVSAVPYSRVRNYSLYTLTWRVDPLLLYTISLHILLLYITINLPITFITSFKMAASLCNRVWCHFS